MTKTRLANAEETAAEAQGGWSGDIDVKAQLSRVHDPILRRLRAMKRTGLAGAEERMEATLRELDVHYGAPTPARTAWWCDLLPHIFSPEEWTQVEAGVRQRLVAFERFLQDIYGKRKILRDGTLPIHPVLGSGGYQNATFGLPCPQNAYLHLCGVSLVRMASGKLAVKRHLFSRPSGIGYMMQNRRALARVLPRIFEDQAVSSLAGIPFQIAEGLRRLAPQNVPNPSSVLLSPGPESAAYAEHGFLARRMGIPLVQGGDLLVLDDRLFLKTVRGLKRVDVVYNRVPEAWLDPLVLKKGSNAGVPGLVHCIRSGTVTLLNAVGSEVADDRQMLCLSDRIIRYYLGESPIIPTYPTYWIGDIDQRELILDHPERFDIYPVLGDEMLQEAQVHRDSLRRIFQKTSVGYVAQPIIARPSSLQIVSGKFQPAAVEHIVYAMKEGTGFTVFPGALTRVISNTEQKNSWKDSWVLAGKVAEPTEHGSETQSAPPRMHSPEVTSRVAEAFYWMGRYLERAYHQAYLIQVIETLETEELNPTERKLYRPMWSHLLSPLDRATGQGRRRIPSTIDRYRLVLMPERGSVVSTLERAIANAEALQESMSPEAWTTLNSLYQLFQRTRFKEDITDEEGARVALRLAAKAAQRIPQFFAIAQRTMLGDDSWRFCEVGQSLELAIIAASALEDLAKFFRRTGAWSEIQLSAFLRLLASRDVYRRLYQVRAQPAFVMEMLWQHPEAPRSVWRNVKICRELLETSRASRSSVATAALTELDSLLARIKERNWRTFFQEHGPEEVVAGTAKGDPDTDPLLRVIEPLLNDTLGIHGLISDGFLSHQAYIMETVQPMLQGFRDGV